MEVINCISYFTTINSAEKFLKKLSYKSPILNEIFVLIATLFHVHKLEFFRVSQKRLRANVELMGKRYSVFHLRYGIGVPYVIHQ